MVRFVRYHGDERPKVLAAPAGDTHPVLVQVKDYLTYGEEIEMPVDLGGAGRRDDATPD